MSEEQIRAEPDWVAKLRDELMLSKITHNFTLSRDELMHLFNRIDELQAALSAQREPCDHLFVAKQSEGDLSSHAVCSKCGLRPMSQTLGKVQGDTNHTLTVADLPSIDDTRKETFCHSAKSVPDGYVLVPIEPTDNQWQSAFDIYGAQYHADQMQSQIICIKEIYKAMLAAAPQVPTDDERVRELPAYGIIDPDYARVFTKARCIAWQYGYAVLMNGSFTRDLDLLLVPWTDQASRSITPQDLIQRICSDCGLQENGHPPTSKPHGRTAYTLLFNEFGDPRFIDISFMPTIVSKSSGEQSKTLTKESMVKGGRYNWQNQPERLVYLGYNWSGNGYWHQFEKVEEPNKVWCEVLSSDLHMLEETKL